MIDRDADLLFFRETLGCCATCNRASCLAHRALYGWQPCALTRRGKAAQEAGACEQIVDVWKSSDLCAGTRVTDTVERVPREMRVWGGRHG